MSCLSLSYSFAVLCFKCYILWNKNKEKQSVAPIVAKRLWPQPEAKKTKVCPVCGEEIDADAVVCPVCHEIIDDYEKRQKTSKSIAETGLRTSGDAITFELSSKDDEIEDTEEDDVDEEESLPLFVKIIFCIIAFVAALGISTIIMQALFSDSIVKPHSVALATAISYGVYSFLRKLYFTFHG